MAEQSDISSICIVGGGTAGWMAAAALAAKLAGLPIAITLVESDEVGTVGVGEATLPHIRAFNLALGIDEAEMMRATEATYKLGIEFCDWGRRGDRYIHPFGDFGPTTNDVPFYQYWLKLRQSGDRSRIDEYSYPVIAAEQGRFRRPSGDLDAVESTFGYAYQFDAGLYAKFLRSFAEKRGVSRTEGRVVRVVQDGETGFVRDVVLTNGTTISADLFIDCSGFRGLLIETALQSGYDDWSAWLPCNRAIAVPTQSNGALRPFTRATARTAGWQWRIPLQHRVGNGHVYCSSFISDDEAHDQLVAGLDAPMQAEPRRLSFTTGRRREFWKKNVVAIGLAGGFLEPLESTSINLIQDGITELLAVFPDKGFAARDIAEYNRRIGLHYERIRDFLLLHYVATQRDDSEMWRHFRNLRLPDSLSERIDAWRTRGHLIQYEFGLFLSPSWVAVFLGQNLVPDRHDPRVENMSVDALTARASDVRAKVDAAVRRTPEHTAFIRESGGAARLAVAGA